MHTFLAAALLAAAYASPTTAPATGSTVHIRNDAFIPARLVVHPGTTVTFVNDDDDAHTATGDDGTYDSGGLGTGERWKHVYASAGTFAYHCTMHPFMKAVVVVKP
jgi:plastocyanin